MSRSSTSASEDSVVILARIDEVCDRFEAAWVQGSEPDLAAHLGETGGPLRIRLYRELLMLDLEYRRARGDDPSASTYHDRFPAEHKVTEAVFAPARLPRPALPRARRPEPRAGDVTGLSHQVTLQGDWSRSGGLTPAVLHALGESGYEILGELGRGGMGVVYLARKVALNRLCGLKMILAGVHAGPSLSARFRVEAEAVARLRHPDIVQIYHVGEADGLPFLELEYLPGGSLDRVLGGTPKAPKEAARLVEIVSRAIAEAHRLGIIHRDIKPANILLDSEGRPKVADFGLAKVLDTDDAREPTRTQTILGSPSYMAPEQAEGRNRRIAATTDVYALGAVLYELLTGRPPFRGANAIETLEQVKTVDPVPPSRLVAGLSRDVETICLKCLEKAPAARYPTAEALADDLRRFTAGEPIQAHPASAWTHARKWAARRPAVASALIVGGVAVTLLVAGSFYHGVRLRDEVHRAQSAERSALLQRNLALGAYNRLVFDVQERLGDTSTTRAVRQSLLGTAIDGLDRLARVAETTAPDLSRAVAHQKLGAIYRQIGRTDDARRQFELARSLAERLIATVPADLARQECLRDVVSGLGELSVRLGRFDDAKVDLRRAVSLAEGVVRVDPKRSGARPALLEAYFQLGRSRGFGGEPGQAEALYRRMHEAAKQWVADQPEDHQARNLLGMSLRKLGDSKKLGGDPAGSRVFYEQAIEIGRGNVLDEPNNLTFRYQLAVSLDDLAGVAASQKHVNEARALFAEAEALHQSRASADPDDLDTQIRLISTQSRFAQLEREARHYDLAIGLLNRALERLRDLDRQGRLAGIPSRKTALFTEFTRELSLCREALLPAHPPR